MYEPECGLREAPASIILCEPLVKPKTNRTTLVAKIDFSSALKVRGRGCTGSALFVFKCIQRSSGGSDAFPNFAEHSHSFTSSNQTSVEASLWLGRRETDVALVPPEPS